MKKPVLSGAVLGVSLFYSDRANLCIKKDAGS
jgi:hypothetical protein